MSRRQAASDDHELAFRQDRQCLNKLKILLFKNSDRNKEGAFPKD